MYYLAYLLVLSLLLPNTFSLDCYDCRNADCDNVKTWTKTPACGLISDPDREAVCVNTTYTDPEHNKNVMKTCWVKLKNQTDDCKMTEDMEIIDCQVCRHDFCNSGWVLSGCSLGPILMAVGVIVMWI